MKKIKKLLAFGLALIMCLGMAVTASAGESDPDVDTPPAASGSNSITVNNAKKGETYTIYKLLDLTVHTDSETQQYDGFSYIINSDWQDFWTTGAGASYIDTNTAGTSTYVVWKSAMSDATAMETFGKAAATAAANKTPLSSQTPTKDGSVVFSNLDNGYYLITSTYGTAAIVGSTPTNSTQSINEKNTQNTGDKKVKEGDDWARENDAQVGDTISFRGQVTIQKNAVNVVYHDTMSDGLTFNSDVKVYTDEDLTQELATSNYTIVTSGINDTFQVRFNQTYVDTITTATTLYIGYSAVLNDNAEVSNPETNSANVSWGNGSSTEFGTETKTYSFNIHKYDGTDTNKGLLAGAKFQLFDSEAGTTPLFLAVSQDGLTYRVVNDSAELPQGYTMAAENKIVTVSTGEIKVEGVDNKTYYLMETDAPLGYNTLTNRVAVAVGTQNNVVSEIENMSGTQLPSTGGIGTTIFYVVGGILVVAAGVLLITRKRMSKEQ